MNKRILALMLALVMSFTLLAGCGSKDNNVDTQPSDNAGSVTPDDPQFGKDLTAFYDHMMNAAVEPPMMMLLEGEMLDSTYPGLSAIETRQCVAAMPAISAVAAEFAFVEVSNAADAKIVRDIFQDRIDAQVNGGAWYPETVEAWQNCSEIVEIGNYVCLFVHADKDILVKAFREGTDVPQWCVPEIIDDEANYDDDMIDGDFSFDGNETEGSENNDTNASGDVVIEFPTEDEDPVQSQPAEIDPIEPEPSVSTAPADPSAEPSTAPSQAPVSNSIDLTAFYDKMMNAAVEPPFMMLLEGEYLDNFYPGLTAIETTQCVAAMPAISAVAAEFVFVEVANSADIDAVRAILEARIDAQINGGAWYPETVDGWENHSEIVVIGNCVCLFVHMDKDILISALKSGSDVPAWCEPVVFDDEASYGGDL